MKNKVELLNMIVNSGTIDIDDYYVVRMHTSIDIQGEYTDEKIEKLIERNFIIKKEHQANNYVYFRHKNLLGVKVILT